MKTMQYYKDNIIVPSVVSLCSGLFYKVLVENFSFLKKVMPSNTIFFIVLMMLTFIIIIGNLIVEKNVKFIKGIIYLTYLALMFVIAFLMFDLLYICTNSNEENMLKAISQFGILVYIGISIVTVNLFFSKKRVAEESDINAVTGTCIPFNYDEEKNEIKTYLIFNDAYKKNKWMFPGGHAFAEDVYLERVAVTKAEDEAGLKVEIIDLDCKFSMSSMNTNGKFNVLQPPHYTYWFKLPNDARCYSAKGHRNHYDAIYVCEVREVMNEVKQQYERVEIPLSNKTLTQKDIATTINKAISNYAMEKPENERNQYYGFGDYILQMLCTAHRDYVAYLAKQKGQN